MLAYKSTGYSATSDITKQVKIFQAYFKQHLPEISLVCFITMEWFVRALPCTVIP